MRATSKPYNPSLAGVPPKPTTSSPAASSRKLLKTVSEIRATADDDSFAPDLRKDFLGEILARTEGQEGRTLG